jgi:hypothetical protein
MAKQLSWSVSCIMESLEFEAKDSRLNVLGGPGSDGVFMCDTAKG